MSNNHTPGTWVLENGSKSCHCCFTQTIYAVTGPNKYDYVIIAEMLDGNEYDANLMSAAPDLLDALETALPFVRNDNVTLKIRSAIAKARGQ